jgi:uncharacterized membrane protein
MTTLALLVLAAVGFAISAFFTLITYGVVPLGGRSVRQICRMDRDTCITVLGHPDARIVGVPNSLIGMLFYILVVASAAAGMGSALWLAALIASWIAVGLGVYLVHSLLFKLRIPCVLCYTAHGLNLIIALLMLITEMRQ